NIGAALGNGGAMTVNDSEMAHGSVSIGCAGGALYSGGGGATLNRAFIHHNRNAICAGSYVDEGNVIVRDSAIVDNDAPDSGTFHGDTCYGQGGGVYAYQGDVLIENTTIGRNHAQRMAGGIMNYRARFRIINSTIVANQND